MALLSCLKILMYWIFDLCCCDARLLETLLDVETMNLFFQSGEDTVFRHAAIGRLQGCFLTGMQAGQVVDIDRRPLRRMPLWSQKGHRNGRLITSTVVTLSNN